MPAFAERYGPWAIVAGASEGLGAAFAEALAARGLNLLLLARRGDLLESVAAGLRAKHDVKIETAPCDLARADLADALVALIGDRAVGLGIYNAAYVPVGEMHTRPLDDLMRVVDVNVRAPLVFARTLAPSMVARGRGGLILMTSLTGFQGVPRFAAYAASKAFNMVLGEALWSELRPHGVDVVAAAAGAVRTPGYARAARSDAPGTLDAPAVAEAALNALGNGPMLVPGRFNKFAHFVMSRFLSRRTAVNIMARSTRDVM